MARWVNNKVLVAADSTSQKEKNVVPPHLRDLQEADLPETQHGLVISEIAQFRERAAKRECEKMRELQSQIQQTQDARGMGKGALGYNKPFVREQEREREPKWPMQTQTDEELEAERKESRRHDEEVSFRDRERRYLWLREHARILALERTFAPQRQTADSEARERVELRMQKLRCGTTTRATSHCILRGSSALADLSAAFEEEEAANLARQSEDFLAPQMGKMQALAEEQRCAGLLLDDNAPVGLSVSLTDMCSLFLSVSVFGELTSLQSVIGRKFELLVKPVMTQYLGDAEEAEELIMFVVERALNQCVSSRFPILPVLLPRPLHQVLEEEAVDVTTAVWRQLIFESMAYAKGLHTDRMFID
ncbi:hypothetical protein B0H12DRAFT_1298749 [Mycena haematopus]|nr:hypothetical protein B0H12DRAFT_1298749 [Mycena haematopus]